MIRILLQTTIPAVDDDWSIRRYSLLRNYLASLENARGEPLFAVTARDREPDASGHDPLLCGLADSDFDEIWLFAADDGYGFSGEDCARHHALSGSAGAASLRHATTRMRARRSARWAESARPTTFTHAIRTRTPRAIAWTTPQPRPFRGRITTPGGTAITRRSPPSNLFTTCCGFPTPRRNSSSFSQLTRTKAGWAPGR